MKKRTSSALVGRVLSRLSAAEAEEIDPWLRDDLRIARLTVAYAATGEAVGCSPDVLASYMVLGLHPEKVWPAIQARRMALSPGLEAVGDVLLVPKKPAQSVKLPRDMPLVGTKKPAQSVKLWCIENKEARAVNSRLADTTVLREPSTNVPMAAPSIAALYPNSDASPSAKKRGYTYDEWVLIVKHSDAPQSIRLATLNALKARGPWPDSNGTATGIICVSLKGMMSGDMRVCRSTARWRARRACKLGYWRKLRDANSWSNCPKCGAKRVIGKCGHFDEHERFLAGCGYQGRANTPEGKANFDEFCRPYMYEIRLDAFQAAEPCGDIRRMCREVGSSDWRTYEEYKGILKRRPLRADSERKPEVTNSEHLNVTEMPARKSAQPDPDTPPPTEAPARQPAAEHPHRNSVKPRTVVHTEIDERSRKAAELLFQMCGLADLGAVPQIAISIVAEARYRGIEIEDAATLVAECATRDQKKGVALTRFYFRDMKWRSTNGGTQSSAASERADRIKRNILDGFAENARARDQSDGPERQE
jgi:hypothetical protein